MLGPIASRTLSGTRSDEGRPQVRAATQALQAAAAEQDQRHRSDSRNVKTLRGWVQGYNAQAACTEDQIVLCPPDVVLPLYRESTDNRKDT
jgi:hypothetical protein